MKNKPIPIPKNVYDNPEHFRDRICSFSSDGKDIPEQIKDILLEQSGFRCSICREPYYQIHHITQRNDSGKTEINNLIVLCPNCHYRVHHEGIPNEKQLRHIRMKQEISYELPIIGRFSNEEINLIKELSKKCDEDLLLFSSPYWETIPVEDENEAMKIARKKAGFLYLELEGIIQAHYDACIERSDGGILVTFRIRITTKGIKWIKYLRESGQFDLFF